MKQPSLLSHLRDIIILPFTVTIIIPFIIYDGSPAFIPDNVIFKLEGLVLLIPGITLLSYSIFLFRTVGKGTLAAWSATQKLGGRGPLQIYKKPHDNRCVLHLNRRSPCISLHEHINMGRPVLSD